MDGNLLKFEIRFHSVISKYNAVKPVLIPIEVNCRNGTRSCNRCREINLRGDIAMQSFNRRRLHVVTSRLMGAIRSRDRLEK